MREVELSFRSLQGRVLAQPPTSRSAHSLRLLALTPTYLPEHRRGAEVSLHATLRELVRRGHEARVVVDDGSRTVLDEVEVIPQPGRQEVRELAEWSDIVLGQLTARQRCLALAARYRRPAVYFVHIGNVDRRALAGHPALTVFSSATVQESNAWITPALVLHPPIDANAYATAPGSAITLVNLTEPKGTQLFYELARRLPDHSFLGVRGWGAQDSPPDLPNLEVIGPLDDMRGAYSRTRVLLVPSVYESYGRVALEAAASGIPTVACPVGGLMEAMGDAGVWVDRNDTEAWVAAIAALDDDQTYEARANLVRERFRALDPEAEMSAFEAALRRILDEGRP